MTPPDDEPRSRRLCLQLDAAVTTESMILAQLDRLPQRRRAEWLRSLLAQGFLAERQWLQGLNASPVERPMTLTPSSAAPPSPTPSRSEVPTPASQALTAPPTRQPSTKNAPEQPNDKPFAHLRALIG